MCYAQLVPGHRREHIMFTPRQERMSDRHAETREIARSLRQTERPTSSGDTQSRITLRPSALDAVVSSTVPDFPTHNEDERMDMVDAHATNTNPGTLGAIVGDGAYKLGLPRRIGLNFMHARFNARYFLTMYVFKPCLGFGTAVANVAPTKSYLLSPLYCFNPGMLAWYLDTTQKNALLKFVYTELNIRVKSVKGALKFVGLTSPFVSNTAEQAASNSNIIVAGLIGHALERRCHLAEGRIKLDETAPSVTEFDIIPEGRPAGEDLLNYTNSIPNSGDISYTTALSGAIKELQNPLNLPGTTFTEHSVIGAPVMEMGTGSATSTVKVTSAMDYSKYMTPVDLTQSQSSILGWNVTPENAFLNVKAVSSPGNYNVPASTIVTNMSLTENGAVVAEPPRRIGSVNPSELIKNYPEGFYITNNNVYRVGEDNVQHQTALYKHYLQIVPPPTISPSKVQDLFMQTVLDTEMILELNQDMLNTGEPQGSPFVYIPKDKFIGYPQVHVDGARATMFT